MMRLLQALMLALVLGLGAGPVLAGVPMMDQDATKIIDEFDGAPDDFAAAVPEPTAVIAMGVGLATVAFAVRRRGRR